MNYFPRLYVMGESFDIDTFDITYYRHLGFKNRPAPYVLGGIIKLRLSASQKDERLEWWMLHTEKDQLCKLIQGKLIVYTDRHMLQEVFRYQFNDAALKSYHSYFHNELGMITEIEITAAIQEYRGETLIKSWQESFIPETTAAKLTNESQEPRILDFYHTDVNGNKEPQLSYGDKAYLILKSQHMTGKQVDLTLNLKNIDFKYQGERMPNDTIQDYRIQSDNDKVPITIIEEEDQEIS